MKQIPQNYEIAKVSDLTTHPRNPRQGDVAMIGESIEETGFYGAAIVQRSTGYVLAGNHRLLAAKEQGATELPVIMVDVDDDVATKILLADNRIPDLAGYRDDDLKVLLDELAAGDSGLAGTGYDMTFLTELSRALEEDSSTPPAADDVPDVPVEPRSVTGEVYELGPHRLLCGDCRDPDALRELLGDISAEVMWTDPPYGVSYVGKTKNELTIQNDDSDGLVGLLHAAFTSVDVVLAAGGRFYIAAPAGPRGTDFRLAIPAAGWVFHEALVWVKDSMVLGHSDYHYRHEDVLYGWKPGEGRVGRGKHNGSRWYGDNSQTTVFDVPRPKRSPEHPTMKPVDLIVQQLRNSARLGDCVIDPFAGSGSTLIACEQLGLRCFAVEVDRGYCDVIRDRYAAFVAEHARGLAA